MADPWTDAEDKLLGTAPDREIAKKIKRGEDAVQRRRTKLLIPAWLRDYPHRLRGALGRLGKVSDAELAEQIGVSRKWICEQRVARGIKPAHPQNSPRKKKK